MGLQTPPTRRASRVERSERETGAVCRTDEWLRELFAGTYDFREAQARPRARASNQAHQGSKIPQIER
jgi:hypothetical protein